jgi:tape measure domain-containing protein
MDSLDYAIHLDSAEAQAALQRFGVTANNVTINMGGMGKGASAASGGLAALAGNALRMVGLSATLATGVGIVAAAFMGLKQGLTVAAQFEQTNIAFKTLTGSAATAKAVIKELSTMAIDTPMREGQLQGAAKSMLAARVPAEALKGELTAMGNVASATGADIERLSVVYAQVAGKGKLYAEELQQFVEQGAGELRQTVAESMGVTTAKLMDMMSEGKVGFSDLQKALQTLAGSGGKWGKAMQEQSKTTLGLLSSLGDAANKVMRLLAQPINDGPIKSFLTKAVDAATKTATIIEQAMAQGKVGEALKQGLIYGAKLGINALIDHFATIPSRLAASLQRISAAIKAALTGSFDLAKELLSSFDPKKMRFDTANQEAFFNDLAAGAKVADKATDKLNKNWDKLLDAKTDGRKKDSENTSGKSYYDELIKKQEALDELKREASQDELTTLQKVVAVRNELAAATAAESAARADFGPNPMAILDAEKKRIELQRELNQLQKQQQQQAEAAREKLKQYSVARNNTLGELAMLRAQVNGHNAKADAIERALRIQRDTLAIMRQTGASEEQALKLAREKANLEDKRDGKARHISGVRRKTYMGGDTGAMSATGPLANGGLAEYDRLQAKHELSLFEPSIPGYRRDAFLPNYYDPLSNRVGQQINRATGAPALSAIDTTSKAHAEDPLLSELKGIRSEMARIRTA